MDGIENRLEQWGAARQSCPAPNLLLVVSEDVLPEATAVNIRQHLAICALCRQLQADLKSECMEPSLASVHRTGKKLIAPKPNPKPWLQALPYAAAVVIAMGSFVALRDRPAAPVSQTKAVTYRIAIDRVPLKLGLDNAVVWRGEDSSPQQRYLTDLKSALEPYFAGDYQEASKRLAALSATYPKASEPPFYRAISSLLLGDAATAKRILEELRKQPPAHLDADIPWYLASAYERAGETERSANLLKQICQTAGPYQQRACALGPK